MIVTICAGGPPSEIAIVQADVWIGVDAGALQLLKRGIVPTQIVGDFDSIDEEQKVYLFQTVSNVSVFQAEKDETDTDLAIEHALQLSPSQIILTGVTGGRLDHQEAVVRSMLRYQKLYPHIVFSIVNTQNELQYLLPGKHSLWQPYYTYVSFFAASEVVKDVTLRGVKYETTNEQIELDASRFTSNEIIHEQAYIQFSSGICLMIRSMD